MARAMVRYRPRTRDRRRKCSSDKGGSRRVGRGLDEARDCVLGADWEIFVAEDEETGVARRRMRVERMGCDCFEW